MGTVQTVIQQKVFIEC